MQAKYQLGLVAFTILGIPAIANERVRFDNAIIRQPIVAQDFTAAYVDITNLRNTQLTIAGAHASWSETIEFHETVITDDRARMRRLMQLSVEPNKTLTMAPGKIHIMLFGLKLNDTANPTMTFVTPDGEHLSASFEIKSIAALHVQAIP